MNIYRFEFRSILGSIVGWSVALCAMMGIYLSMYPVFQKMGFDANELFSKFPDTLQSLFGMTGINTKEFLGFLPFPLKLAEELAAIGGLMVGTFAATHEARQNCADFLFALPVSRSAVFLAKLGAVTTGSALLYLAIAAFLAVVAPAVAPGEVVPAVSILASAAIPVLIFFLYASAGLLVGVRWPKLRGIAAIGVGSMFFFHIVFSIGKVITKNPDHPIVRATVPVCMFDRALAVQGQLELPYLLLWGCEVAALLTLCFVINRRRDIA